MAASARFLDAEVPKIIERLRSPSFFLINDPAVDAMVLVDVCGIKTAMCEVRLVLIKEALALKGGDGRTDMSDRSRRYDPLAMQAC